MDLNKAAALIGPVPAFNPIKKPGLAFSAVLEQKKIDHLSSASIEGIASNTKAANLKKVLNDMMDNHTKAVSTVKDALATSEHSPDKLLQIQYKTGVFFLREQMFCKTAELCANTLKNFTQMQV